MYAYVCMHTCMHGCMYVMYGYMGVSVHTWMHDCGNFSISQISGFSHRRVQHINLCIEITEVPEPHKDTPCVRENPSAFMIVHELATNSNIHMSSQANQPKRFLLPLFVCR